MCSVRCYASNVFRDENYRAEEKRVCAYINQEYAI